MALGFYIEGLLHSLLARRCGLALALTDHVNFFFSVGVLIGVDFLWRWERFHPPFHAKNQLHLKFYDDGSDGFYNLKTIIVSQQ